jgi:hypothetical protein
MVRNKPTARKTIIYPLATQMVFKSQHKFVLSKARMSSNNTPHNSELNSEKVSPHAKNLSDS